MPTNHELELALQFIKNTDRNVFLTGKAGTGKTTFLHQIKNESQKRMVVVAHTGVAAINAKGVTIHSFFQMPFGPILPTTLQETNSIQRKFSKTKINIIKSLDLVVIDEISMVRADLLDGIDQVLRRYKNKQQVFGGAQVLLIGDLQQLAPVVKPAEWSLLKSYYETIYFFSSKVFKEANFINIELKHIYRQANKKFISILNEVRNNQLTEESAKILNQQYQPDFVSTKDDGYITLTTHNNKATAINQLELKKISGKSTFYQAEISGKFSENAYPNAEKLELKVGAQVMFIKNDSSPEKRYFNGKIGSIVYLDDEHISVQCPDDDFEIDTGFETWENVNYTINKETKEITEEKMGSFTQIPLRLAWAITIHKSQGLTFEKAIIDAEASFAHGQTYVALSRCTTLDGIVLKTPIGHTSIVSDQSINHFTKNVTDRAPDRAELLASQKRYQLNLIADLFNFYAFLHPLNRLIDIYYTNKTSLLGMIIEPLLQIKEKGISPLLKVSTSFNQQLAQLSTGILDLKNDALIDERFKKAAIYFKEQTSTCIEKPFNKISFSTDNKAVEKDLEKQLVDFKNLLFIKQFCLDKLQNGFDASTYIKARATALLEQETSPKQKKKIATTDGVLVQKLRELRSHLAEAENKKHFQIFTQKTLYALCDVLPQNASELLKVHGMGKIRVKQYGEEILETIQKYQGETNPLEVEKKEKKKKIPTAQISLTLFRTGLTIEEIAKKREFTTSTIEGHLAKFIASGHIDITDLMPQKKYNKLKKEIAKANYESLTELKEQLNNSYSYSDLRTALLAIAFDREKD